MLSKVKYKKIIDGNEARQITTMETAGPEKKKATISYIMVHNIPKDYRASDLRNFFTQIVETGGFRCFHYRHRPEVQKPPGSSPSDEASGSNSDGGCRRGETCCCIVMVRTERLDELMESYNGAFWVTRDGETLTSKCHLKKVAIADDDSGKTSRLYLSPREERDRRAHAVVTRSDLLQMIELRPPAALPAGNVGTPTSYILKQINECKFPATLIGKLGIEFPRMRAKGIYGSVPMDYGTNNLNIDDSDESIPADNDSTKSTSTSNEITDSCQEEEEDGKPKGTTNESDHLFKKPANVAKHSVDSRSSRIKSRAKRPAPDLSKIPKAEEVRTFVRTQRGHIVSGLAHPTKGPNRCERSSSANNKSGPLPSGSKATGEEDGRSDKDDESAVGNGSDSDDGEEWDRHEALHNDVTSQERTKERLFEEEQEVVWEKGGSGLVFYTDAQVWDEAEGDFDAKTSDDWDIDTSAYYADGAGDKDAKDFISMQHFNRLRDGKTDDDDNRVGYFEKFTRGFGRRILEGQGWSEGRGVGKSKEGPSEPIESDGQHPRDRSGFGYRGEKLDWTKSGRKSKRERVEDAFSSIYDERFAAGEDPGSHDRSARSQEPTILKYRKVFIKTSSATPGDTKSVTKK